MGKIISNGIEYVGLTNINGVYIDTNNIIVPQTAYSVSMSYTATEDCIMVLSTASGNNSGCKASIDGIPVGGVEYSTATIQLLQYYFLKKGQTISVSNSLSGSVVGYAVYGVQQGSTSQGSSGGIDYSTTEQKTGQKWVDGKDIYQKTYVAITDTQYSSENAYLIGTIPNGLDNVIDFEGSLKTSDGYGYSSLNGIGNITNWNFGIHISNTNLLLYGGSSFSSLPQNATCIVTIKYTKSTT